jgi:replicative DNA helicase
MAEELSPRGSAGGRRVPPHDLHAEESLLGAMMLEPEAIASAAGVVRADDFYKPAHSHIFDAVHALYATGQPVDAVTVADELRRNGLLETVGGVQVLLDIMASTPATTSAGGYARIIEEFALLRRLIGVAGEIAEIGYGMPEDVTKALDRAEALVYDVNQRRVTDSTSKIEDLLGLNLDRLEQLYGRGDAITGVPTGYVDLDDLLSGLQPSNLVVVGARPAMGKCVAFDTPIIDPATGDLRTAADLYRAGTAGDRVSVLTLTDERGVDVAVPSAFVDDGIKRVYRVRTRSGREVRTTASHPFLTPGGWVPLADLAPGRVVGVPAAVRVFGAAPLPPDELVMLAHLVMAPGADEHGPKLWTENREVATDIEYRGAAFGVEVVDRTLPGGGRTWDVTSSEALQALARRHGVAADPGARRVPKPVFRLPREQLAQFLNRALGAASSVWRPQQGAPGRLVVASRSPRLAQDLRHLLLRFGVGATVEYAVVAVEQATRAEAGLVVTGAEDLSALASEIGVLGREAELGAILAHARAVDAEHDAARVPAAAAAGAGPRSGSGSAGGANGLLDPPASDLPVREGAVLWDEVVAIDDDGDVQVYDLTVPETHNFVAADVFVHNTSFALGMASHAALHASKPVLVFSLEMGSLELSQRLLSAEARIDSKRVRTGQLSEDDWSRISQAIGRLASAPIWIDDNPNLTVMEIRSKARRLKSQVGDLGMVVVDYLQLMTGRGKAENRQVEVSEMSRGLKILARELETPVVALSQLSRQLELRADKRPMLADLRESGCLTGDARVLRADTGAEVTIGELAASGERDVPVWSLDTDLRMVPATMTHAFPTGVKEVFDLRLASGRRVTASANHPFLTVDGWVRLDELAVGSRIAVPRVIPAPKETQVWPEPEIVMLAHLLGDGCVAPRQPIHYTSADPACLDAVEHAAAHFGITPLRIQQAPGSHVYLPAPRTVARGRRNPIAEWLDQWGLYGRRSHEKFVPDPVFALDEDQIALFLGHLWATGGSIDLDKMNKNRKPRIYLGTSSRRLADDLQRLLLRFSILTTITHTRATGMYAVDVVGADNMRQFVHHISVIGTRAQRLPAVTEWLAGIKRGSSNDSLPESVTRMVRDAQHELGISDADLARRAGRGTQRLHQARLTRERLRELSDHLDDPNLGRIADSDVSWDRVNDILPVGKQHVFDATVESTHNFIANGIVLENSIEQDADVVMFIYRDDVYHTDSADRGQAEIIVAKHRNGPTGVCRLAFLEQFTRFANMAKLE